MSCLAMDASHIRKGNGPAIMTSIRHLCMNLFESESSSMSLAKKRRKAAKNAKKNLCGLCVLAMGFVQ